jgi:hypothetical protein
MHVGMPTAPVHLNAMVLGHIRHICLLYQCMKNISLEIKEWKRTEIISLKPSCIMAYKTVFEQPM